MDHRAITGNVVTAVVVAGLMGLVGLVGGIFDAGNRAIDEKLIKEVVNQIHIRDNGTTYSASLASIDVTLSSIDATLFAIKEDVDDLENAVGELARE